MRVDPPAGVLSGAPARLQTSIPVTVTQEQLIGRLSFENAQLREALETLHRQFQEAQLQLAKLQLKAAGPNGKPGL